MPHLLSLHEDADDDDVEDVSFSTADNNLSSGKTASLLQLQKVPPCRWMWCACILSVQCLKMFSLGGNI